MVTGMLVLGLDTATERTVIALGERTGDGVTLRASADIDAPRAALGRSLPALADMLEREGLSATDIGEVVVGRGPGSFTGVRIGVATAKGLAHGLGVALLGVSTLDAVAWGYAAAGVDGVLGVVGDAMRGEVYPVLYELEHGEARRLGPDRVMKPSDVAAEWAALGRPVVLAGNALAKHEALFTDALVHGAQMAPPSLWLPSAGGLLAAYAHARLTGEIGDGDPGTLLPVYTRLSDAEEAERARGEAPR